MKKRVGLYLLAAAGLLSAQETIRHAEYFQAAIPPPADAASTQGNAIFVGTGSAVQIQGFEVMEGGMSFGGKVVKQAPYSADSITETVQTLADGNRITGKTTAQVWRDSEGRTRRQEKLGAIGPWAAAGEVPEMTFINDPVAGVNYVLEPGKRIARKMTVRRHEIPDASALRRLQEMVPPPGGPETITIRRHAISEESKTESLGRRSFEGVMADGTRTTVVIPAGQVGNERPIEIVSERWYSPELQVVVSSRRVDPRFGETTFRLTNIQRVEPMHSLFEVPPDYTVKDSGADVLIRTQEKIEHK